MNDLFELLRDEHDKHRTLIDIVSKTSGDSRGRREVFARLARELRAHANAEERTLYARMLRDPDVQPEASHSVHEHHQIDDWITELLEKDLSSPGWISTFEKLAERARHHMAEEERETFVAGRRLIDPAESKRLAARFAEEKRAEMEKHTVDL